MRKRGPRTPEEKVRELQDKLHLSAKRNRQRRGPGYSQYPTTAFAAPWGFIPCRKPSRDTSAHA